MSVITIAKPPVAGLDLLQQAIERASQPEPAGLLARYAGQADDGTVRVVAHWESREAALDFFANRLGPVVASLLAPEPAGMPEVVWMDVVEAVSYPRGSRHA
jgi:hypothetical protein